MPRGKAVKALTPKTRPFRDSQVRGLQDCANREGRICHSQLHRVPVPLPVVHTPLFRSWDADPWGPRSAWNGRSQLQWQPMRAQLGPPAPDALLVRPTPMPTSRRGPQASLPPPGETQGQANPPHRDNPSFLSADLWFRDKRRRQWHPTPVLLPRKSHGRRGLVGCHLWGRTESDRTERLHFHFSLSCIGEGNGNPLQCSCLENFRDGGAWWPTIYGVAQSWTWLKRLSSSSRDKIMTTERKDGLT